MEYYQPVPSTRANKKYMVKVWDPYDMKSKTIHFGHPDYEDYRQHQDCERRRHYLTRSAGITRQDGEPTIDDPLSPNFWSRRVLWSSGEPWFFYLPSGYRKTDLKTPDGRPVRII